MTKQQIVEAVFKNQGVGKGATLADIEKVTNAVFGEIVNTLLRGQDIEIRGLGSFTVVNTAERKGRNPKTGDVAIIPAGRKVKFKPGQALRKLGRGSL